MPTPINIFPHPVSWLVSIFSLFEFSFVVQKKNQTSVVHRNRQCDIPTMPLFFIKVVDMQPVPAETQQESMGTEQDHQLVLHIGAEVQGGRHR